MHFTTDKTQAFKCTILHPEEGTDDPRKLSESGGTTITVTPEAWIFTQDQVQTVGYVYLCAYSVYATYSDTNEWYLRTVTQQDPGVTLMSSLTELLPYGLQVYTQGTGIGKVSSDLYSTLQTAYNTASDLVASSDYDECNAAYQALVAAKDAVDESLNVPTDAYYYLVGYRNSSAMTTDGSYLTFTASYTAPETPTVDDANYIWKVIDAEDGYVYLQNYGTGMYAGTVSSNSTAIPVTEQPEARYKFVYNSYNTASLYGYYNITPERSDEISMNVASSNIVFWGYLTSDTGNLWTITAIDSDAVDALEEAVEQQKRNSTLETLYKEALESYNNAHAYVADEGDIYNGNFDFAGLITSADQLSSNGQEESEGSLEGLTDQDVTTYFHSRWNGDAVGDYVYVQVDLGSEYQTLLLREAKRVSHLSGANPATFEIYASNDAENWYYEGAFDVSYDYNTTSSDGTEYANAVAINGFAMSQPYRYIRYTVTANGNGETFSSYPLWYLSELDAFTGTEDTENSYYYQVSEATRTTFETQLAAARSEYLAGTATQTTIDAFQSAYDALMDELPVSSRLLEAIETAKAAVPADSVIGDEIGMFPQTSVDALNTTITEVEASVTNNMTLSEINNGISTLETALETFYNSAILPEAGKYYTLRGLTNSSTNTRGYNAMIYSLGNDTTAYLRSLAAAEDGGDALDPVDNLNYVWYVEEVDHNSIVLRNVGTGFYMGKQSTLNGAIHNVPEKTTLGLEHIKTVAGFFIEVGDELYVNFMGNAVYMVAWNSHSGADNSSLTFKEVNMEDFTGSTSWPVTANSYQILTLPFAILPTLEESEGTIYDVLGYKEDGTNYTIELAEYDGSEIPAGVPFIVLTNEEVTSLSLVTSAESIDEYETTATASSNESGTMTGTIGNTTLTEPAKVIISNGVASIIGGGNVPRSISGNSGYINNVATTETGTDRLTLSASITSGIGAAKVVDANAKVDVYTISGVKVRGNAAASSATSGLPKGLYIVGGEKVLVK